MDGILRQSLGQPCPPIPISPSPEPAAFPGGQHDARDVAPRWAGVAGVQAKHVEHVPEVEAHRLHAQQHLARPGRGRRQGRGRQAVKGAACLRDQGGMVGGEGGGVVQQAGFIADAGPDGGAQDRAGLVIGFVVGGRRWSAPDGPAR